MKSGPIRLTMRCRFIRPTAGLIWLGLILLVMPATYALAINNDISIESAGWRFEFDNDLFFHKDDKISSGLSLQHYSAIASSWNKLPAVPDFVRSVGNSLSYLSVEGLNYRSGLAIGQVIQTPSDLTRRDLIIDDVPYAGVLTVQASWYAFNNQQFRGIEMTAGISGPLSLAEYTQRTIHRLLHNEQPQGWRNQLKTEPLMNLNVMRKVKIIQISYTDQLALDITLDGHIALGNLFTKASTGLEMRMGHNLPRGFLYITDPVGLSMHYLATLKPKNPHQASLYASAVLRTRAFAHNIFFDGNMFRESHHVDKKTWVGLFALGLHYEAATWGLHFNLLSTTRNVERHQQDMTDSSEKLGTVDFEWRF